MANTPYYDPRVVIYEHKMFLRLATAYRTIELQYSKYCLWHWHLFIHELFGILKSVQNVFPTAVHVLRDVVKSKTAYLQLT